MVGLIDLIFILGDKKLAAEMNNNNDVLTANSSKGTIVLELTGENQAPIDFLLIAIINNQTQNGILHMIAVLQLKIQSDHMGILPVRKFTAGYGLELFSHVGVNNFAG